MAQQTLDCPVTATPVPSAIHTTSGSSASLTGYGRAHRLIAELNVTAVEGTSPTLDVVIEDTLDGTNWNPIGSFTQKRGTDREVLRIAHPFTDRLRARWALGGTAPRFTFAVIWQAKYRRHDQDQEEA